MSQQHLFVYGTLRRGYENPFAQALHAGSTHLGMGTIPGKLFVLGNRSFIYPGATYEPECGDRVVGEVLQLHDPEFLLPQMDAYEGIGPNATEAHEYERILVEVTVPDGKIDAWCYVCPEHPPGRLTIPSGDFADVEPLS